MNANERDRRAHAIVDAVARRLDDVASANWSPEEKQRSCFHIVRALLEAEEESGAEPRELLCMLCGRDYPCWSADNDLWNAVMREDGADEYQFVCPTCFTVRAAFLGVTTMFRLTNAHDAPEPEPEEGEPDGEQTDCGIEGCTEPLSGESFLCANHLGFVREDGEAEPDEWARVRLNDHKRRIEALEDRVDRAEERYVADAGVTQKWWRRIVALENVRAPEPDSEPEPEEETCEAYQPPPPLCTNCGWHKAWHEPDTEGPEPDLCPDCAGLRQERCPTCGKGEEEEDELNPDHLAFWKARQGETEPSVEHDARWAERIANYIEDDGETTLCTGAALTLRRMAERLRSRPSEDDTEGVVSSIQYDPCLEITLRLKEQPKMRPGQRVSLRTKEGDDGPR